MRSCSVRTREPRPANRPQRPQRLPPPQPLLVILGPTAVGKTRLALALARRLGGEIISADSAQVYRGMDIGTDKPSAAERAAVPHHLVDIRDPDEPFSVADFKRLAEAAVRDIAARRRLPILAGGTGFYIRAVTEGFSLAPPGADPALRRRLQEEAGTHGPQALHAKLAALDPVAAGRIHPHNVKRVVRALEVCLLTGRPFSSFEGDRPAGESPYDALKIGLTRHRDDLYRRIAERVEDQLRRGLVEEVRRLLEQGCSPDLPALRALAYKEPIAYLRGEVSWEEMVRILMRNNRRYAKRQWTWFRRERGVEWFNLSETPEAEVEEAVIRRVREKGWPLTPSPPAPGAGR